MQDQKLISYRMKTVENRELPFLHIRIHIYALLLSEIKMLFLLFLLSKLRLSIPIIFMIFTGKRGLEICCDGIRSFIFMAFYDCRRRRNGWHHFTSSNIIRYTCSDRHKNVWNRIKHSEATCHPADLIIYFTHIHIHATTREKIDREKIYRRTIYQWIEFIAKY